MRYIWLGLVCLLAMCGCDEVMPELLTPPASGVAVEVEETPPTSEVSIVTPAVTPVVTPDILTVRVIYVEPRLPREQETRYPEKAVDIGALVRKMQTFFADELERHGYPRRTFTVRSTDAGRVHVERLTLKHEASFYQTHDGRSELGRETLDYEMFGEYGHGRFGNFGYTIMFIDVPGYRIETFSGDACAQGGTWWNRDSVGGFVTMPRERPAGCASTEKILAHELMHAFGLLVHDWRSDDYMLSYGASPNQISPGAAKWLAHHPVFLGSIPASAADRMSEHAGDVVLQQEPTLQYSRIGTSGRYAFELRFTAWFLRSHLQQESAGFVHGIISADNDSQFPEDELKTALGIHVLRYLDEDTDANVLRTLDNDTLRRQYIDGGLAYVVRFEAEMPVYHDGFILDLLQYDGARHSIYMKYQGNGVFEREW